MKISVIGCGNMASAIMGGMIKNGLVSPEDVTASDVFEPARQRARNNLGVHTVTDNADCVKGADLVLFAVKPGSFAGAAEIGRAHV